MMDTRRRMEIEQMEAGREMDAAVARALGWEDVRREDWPPCHDEFYGLPPESERVQYPPRRDGRERVAPYSTSRIAAMLLVQRMEERGHWWRAQYGYGTHSAVFCKPADKEPAWLWRVMGEAKAPTLPLAICRAALLCVEEMAAHPELTRGAEVP